MQIVKAKYILSRVVYVLAPSNCLRCGNQGGDLCVSCQSFAIISKVPSCFRCNALSANFTTCNKCRQHTPIRRAYIASHYDGVIKDLITRLKYHNAVDNARIIGGLMSENVVDRYDAVVPVPTSAKRYRQRGYNPSLEIARSVSEIIESSCIDGLVRFGNTRQVGADRQQRLSQLEGMIGLKSSSRANKFKGAKILLVDDVLTTGATLNECAKTLKEASAKSIDAVVLAKH